MSELKLELYHDNFQNFKQYNVPKAQLVVADIPYNLGKAAYASNPEWYLGGDSRSGESKKAGKAFFNTDGRFKIPEYMHFCSRLLKKEPKEKGQAPAMIVFCAYGQDEMLIEYGKKYGFMHSYPIFFIKHYSPQALKANMKIVGATEHAIVFHRENNTEIVENTEHAMVLYRDKLPKFNNGGRMIYDWFDWIKDDPKRYPRLHPNQKPVAVLKRLIEIFTDPGDVVIDPCAGSGTTLRAAYELGRNAYGFEVDGKFYKAAQEKMLNPAREEHKFEQMSFGT